MALSNFFPRMVLRVQIFCLCHTISHKELLRASEVDLLQVLLAEKDYFYFFVNTRLFNFYGGRLRSRLFCLLVLQPLN